MQVWITDIVWMDDSKLLQGLYRQLLWLKDLPKVPTWQLECNLNLLHSGEGTKLTTKPPRPTMSVIKSFSY